MEEGALSEYVEKDDASGFFEEDDHSSVGDIEDPETSTDEVTSSRNLYHNKLVHRDVRQVSLLRTLVILVLLATAFITAEIVFLAQMHAEEQTLRTSFEQRARTILQSFETQVESMMDVSKSLSQHISASATLQEWPFVTVPQFATLCRSPLHVTRASSISFIPILSGEDSRRRVLWEHYASEKHRDLSRAALFASNADDDVRYFPTNRTIEQGIYAFNSHTTYSVPVPHSDPLLMPVWQTAPEPMGGRETGTQETRHLVRTLFNLRSNSERRTGLDDVVALGVLGRTRPVITPVLWGDSNGTDLASYATPGSSMYYPIHDSDGNLVAVLDTEFQWKQLLWVRLNPNEVTKPPLLVTLEHRRSNPCSNENSSTAAIAHHAARLFSFHVQKENVTFAGAGDLHDTELDFDLHIPPVTLTFDAFSSLLGRHQNEDVVADAASRCFLESSSFQVSVHLTRSFVETYETGQPALKRWLVLLTFGIMWVLIAIYDALVDKRQGDAIAAKERSDRIVRSMFPKSVRDRLYNNFIAKEKAHDRLKKLEQWNLRAARAAGKISKGGFAGLFEAPSSKLRQLASGHLSPYGCEDSHNQDGEILQELTNRSGTGSMVLTQRSKAEAMRYKLESPSGFAEPIADLYPAATILFADIAGFTAWSSEREPSQVFTLLECVFGGMDKATRRLKVFKVETVGDCFKAATGLPESQDDHAVRMARFSRTCLTQFKMLTQSLETKLGPGTAELSLRIGIHSGPVTAGVLRGRGARFQLFGDTVNVAGRIESTGSRNKVHLSAETAALLIAAGRESWIEKRKDRVLIKGKGECQTWWLLVSAGGRQRFSSCVSTASFDDSNSSRSDDAADFLISPIVHLLTPEGTSRTACTLHMTPMNRRVREIVEGTHLEHVMGLTKIDVDVQRLVDWNTEVLLSLLKRVAAAASVRRRQNIAAAASVRRRQNKGRHKAPSSSTLKKECARRTVREEIQPVISLPAYNEDVVASSVTAQHDVLISDKVKTELRDYVAAVASGYNDRNAFHNYLHASHVILSASKLLKRIMLAEEHYRTAEEGDQTSRRALTARAFHKHTYGIAADPLSQFAVVFAALIHDVGHKGVPNPRLAVEEPTLASKYKNQSLAEQRSVDLAWDLLLLPHFDNLRACLFQEDAGDTEDSCRRRFRALVVNSVMATDIFDKELKAFRDDRWARAFYKKSSGSLAELASWDGPSSAPEEEEDQNRKATIIIEHVIQASDVAHTMQHWHVYTKWNERLFQEMYIAWLQDRSSKNPAEGWYQGELWFFDNYVIPLAGKLGECGVFGVSSDEYLTYAQQNRSEWERKGQWIVREMTQKAEYSAKKLGLVKQS